jgi:uncharacterized membrane protein YvlD (DUF360 family)
MRPFAYQEESMDASPFAELVPLEIVLLAVFLATLINGLVEYLLVPIVEWLQLPKDVLKYVSVAVAVAVCWGYQVNFLAGFIPSGLDHARWQTAYWMGLVLTAVPLARGANFIADLFSLVVQRSQTTRLLTLTVADDGDDEDAPPAAGNAAPPPDVAKGPIGFAPPRVSRGDL